MASPEALAPVLDREYAEPSIDGFYSPYDLVLVTYETIDTDDGPQRWRRITTKRGDTFLDDYAPGAD